jgi:hypothetical protein
MAENTNPQEVKSETPELTPEQKAEMFNALPGEFQKAISDLNGSIGDHNVKVTSIQSAEKKDPKLIKAEIFEQNPDNHVKLKRLRDQELKLIDSIEKLRAEAYAIIEKDGLMPKELSEDELTKLKAEITDSTKSLRQQVEALTTMEAMMPMFKGKLSIHIDEIKTRRGAAKTGTSTSTGEVKRLRFKKIEVNGVTQDDKGNTVYQLKDGEEKYTFTFASQYLKKQHKGINWSSKDLTDAYLEGKDENNLPEVSEFVMPHTYKADNGNEHTVEYTIKCYR